MAEITMEGKSLQETQMDRINNAAKLADEIPAVPKEDNEVKKALKEEHFLKLYWFKTEGEKLVAGLGVLRQELQKYGQTIVGDYFPQGTEAVISLEEKTISRKPRIVVPD